LRALDRGGILAVAGIYLSQVPALDYAKHLFYEKTLRSVTANTRADGEEFLKIAGEIPIRSSTIAFGLGEANVALQMLKHDQIKGRRSAAYLLSARPRTIDRMIGSINDSKLGHRG